MLIVKRNMPAGKRRIARTDRQALSCKGGPYIQDPWRLPESVHCHDLVATNLAMCEGIWSQMCKDAQASLPVLFRRLSVRTALQPLYSHCRHLPREYPILPYTDTCLVGWVPTWSHSTCTACHKEAAFTGQRTPPADLTCARHLCLQNEYSLIHDDAPCVSHCQLLPIQTHPNCISMPTHPRRHHAKLNSY